ncbi:MAG: two-component system chemotaxis family response regulator CheB [Gammaproteobacteria bacterium]|nr:MAG: two-component system chemotaxis family response regulator CheB [Gammaproteobacteria bacterium]TND06747.1 MAG: two-component system, chemotaxis family, response regulator CheB [Gammaproteobacteria bacterium]
MKLRVLVVEDSRFFQRRMVEMINTDPELEVVGVAANGIEAIEQNKALSPDVITMDIEMPEMDGISAVRRIMREKPTPILMFSVLTTDRAQETLAALDAGAIDYLPKRFEDLSKNTETARRLLCERIRSVANRQRVSLPAHMAAIGSVARTAHAPLPTRISAGQPAIKAKHRSPVELVVIGASTGGPVALQLVLSALSADFPVPILISQHMPGTFTPAFAQRLSRVCAMTVSEVVDGERLVAGRAYIAPGGRQTLVKRCNGALCAEVREAADDDIYRPSVDITFRSVAQHCGEKALAIVLTGMGADGREGARHLKESGASVWAQDESSSVVFGMPGAVIDAGLADEVLPLVDIGAQLIKKI